LHIAVNIPTPSSLARIAGCSVKNDISRRTPALRAVLGDGRDEAGPKGNEQRMEDLEISENPLSRNEIEVHAVVAFDDAEKKRAGTVAVPGQEAAFPRRGKRG
jgi:hypothetical protein